MDQYDKKTLDSLSERLRIVEVRVVEMLSELSHKSQLLDEHRQNVKTIMMRINALFITGLFGVIAALVSALFYK